MEIGGEAPQNLKDKTCIIVINGLGGSGKSSFTQFVEKFSIGTPYSSNELSSVDFVKEVATYCGWRGEKEQIDRDFLHAIKVALTNWRNLPNQKVLEEINKHVNCLKYSRGKGYIPFVNIREPEYIKNFIQLCSNQGYNNIRTLLIVNANKNSNEVSELVNDILYGYKYDDVITNEGSLEDLEDKAKAYFEEIVDRIKTNGS